MSVWKYLKQHRADIQFTLAIIGLSFPLIFCTFLLVTVIFVNLKIWTITFSLQFIDDCSIFLVVGVIGFFAYLLGDSSL